MRVRSADCSAAHRPAGHNMVIHVLAEQSTVEVPGDAGPCAAFGPLPVARCKPWRRRPR